MPVAQGLDECREIIDTPGRDIPCRVTTVEHETCSTSLVTIFNGNGTNISTQPLGSFGTSGFCNFTFSFTAQDSYQYNITTGDWGNILVQGDSDMASLSLTVFILLINAGLFFFPVFFKMNDNEVLNMLFKKLLWLAALAFLAFNTTIMVTLSANAGLGLESELFLYQRIFLWGLWVGFVFLFFNMVVSTLQMWRVQKTKKRMGEE